MGALVGSAGQGGERGRWRDVSYGGGGRGRKGLRRGNCGWAISSPPGSTRKGLSRNFFVGAGPGRADAAVPGPGHMPRCAREPTRVPRAPASFLPAPAGLRGKKNSRHYQDTEAHF